MLVADGPARQRRWTVLIRLIMLIPHYVVLYFLNIAVAVVAFIGWWGALFTGRLPGFAVSFLSGFIRWYTRVQAYGLLLTDQYPPFSLGDRPDYPVRIAIPPRDRLNRVAVLFRFILAIPASLLNGFVTNGATTIVAIVAWFIALINGKLPTSLHLAYTAVLRYSTRVSCYLFMLTAAYPRELFGDGLAEPGAAAVPPAADLDTATPREEIPVDAAVAVDEVPVDAEVPDDEAPVDAEAPDDEVPVDLAAPGLEAPSHGIPGDPAASQPAYWLLLLTRGAQQLVRWFIVIGVVIWAADLIAGAVSASQAGNVDSVNTAIDQVSAANNTLASNLITYQSTAQACTSTACIESADAQAATAFTTFASSVHDTPMPGSAVAAANMVYSDATKIAQDLTQLSHLSPTLSAAQYESAATSAGIEQDVTQLQQDYNALGDALNAAA
jgi:hypothetical protein